MRQVTVCLHLLVWKSQSQQNSTQTHECIPWNLALRPALGQWTTDSVLLLSRFPWLQEERGPASICREQISNQEWTIEKPMTKHMVACNGKKQHNKIIQLAKEQQKCPCDVRYFPLRHLKCYLYQKAVNKAKCEANDPLGLAWLWFRFCHLPLHI